jgi:predicted double-glycine peptidase
MVAQYWSRQGEQLSNDLPSPQQVYERLYKAERRGIALADMRGYFEDLGFHAFTLRGNWSDLETHLSKGRPVIVGLRSGRAANLHFAVLTGVDDKYVRLNDPTRRKPQRRKRADCDAEWAAGEHWMLLATPR